MVLVVFLFITIKIRGWGEKHKFSGHVRKFEERSRTSLCNHWLKSRGFLQCIFRYLSEKTAKKYLLFISNNCKFRLGPRFADMSAKSSCSFTPSRSICNEYIYFLFSDKEGVKIQFKPEDSSIRKHVVEILYIKHSLFSRSVFTQQTRDLKRPNL